MDSLFQHTKSICGNRNSLSLFVEYCGFNHIRIHRQFYNFNQFKSFFVEDNINIEKIDYRDVTNDVDFNEFRRFLHRLINKRYKSNDDVQFFNELHNIINEVGSFGENDEEQVIEAHLNKINEVFCKYRYSVLDNSFLFDGMVYNEVNKLIESISYNQNIHYEDYDEGYKPEIKTALEKDLYELRIFNVGQANCSALIKFDNKEKKDYKVIIVFDLGFQRCAGYNPKLEEMISKIDCDTTILISHYDNDHINNISNHLFLTTCRWIFPNYNGKNKKALKTFQMLLKVATKKNRSSKIYNFPTPFNFSPNISIHQYNGVGKADSYQSTIMNSKCLVCKISIGGKDILIPADALYEEYGDELILSDGKKYDYIIIPHHGCKYVNKICANSIRKIWKFVDKNTTGFVMCGKNCYGHANINHLSWFGMVYLFRNTYIFDDNKRLLCVKKTPKIDYFKITF